MNTDREAILSRVRGALAPLPQRAPLPDWDPELAKSRALLGDRDLLTVFAERIKARTTASP
jgi:L-lactate dehydrogenase complex protein LldG